MQYDDELQKEIHEGYNIQRIREILGMKQETLAKEVNMTQQNISKLEKTAHIPEDTLKKLAKGLGVTIDLIKNFNEEKAVYNIQANSDTTSNNNNNLNYKPTIHHTNDLKEVAALFQQLLQSEKEKVTLLTEANKNLKDLLKQKKR